MCLENKQKFNKLDEVEKYCMVNEPKVVETGFYKSFRWKGIKRHSYIPRVEFNEENLYEGDYITWYASISEHYFFCFRECGHASIIRHWFSHGNEKGLFEMTFLKKGKCYDSIGHLTDKQVNKILKKLSKMDNVGEIQWKNLLGKK